MTKKTLILTIDLSGMPDWYAKACTMQMKDWFNANKIILPIENLIIMPANGPTKLYWLEGEHNEQDTKTLEQIKDRIQPVLEVALDIKIDKEKKFINPNRKANNAYNTLPSRHQEILKKHKKI